MRDNRGYSLVELVVVIAIMAIISTAGIKLISYLNHTDVRQCASETLGQMNKTRVTAMARKNAYMVLRRSSDGVYADIYQGETDPTSGDPIPSVSTKVGSSKVTVSYLTYGATSPVILNDTETLKITFDRSSGAFETINGTDYCYSITFSRSGFSQTMNLYKDTGKFFIGNRTS